MVTTEQFTTVYPVNSEQDTFVNTFGGQQTVTSTNLTFGKFFFNITGHPIIAFNSPAIPRGSNIVLAELRILNLLPSPLLPNPTVTFIAPNRDPDNPRSVWKHIRNDWHTEKYTDLDLTVRDDGGSNLWVPQTITDANTRPWRSVNSAPIGPSLNRFGQKFTLGSTSTLGDVILIIDSTVGTIPASTARVLIHGVDTSNTEVIPDESILYATGSSVSLTGGGSSFTFPVSVTLDAGDYFAVIEQDNPYPIDATNYLNVSILITSSKR